jgi:hypothetical protein
LKLIRGWFVKLIHTGVLLRRAFQRRRIDSWFFIDGEKTARMVTKEAVLIGTEQETEFAVNA